MPGTASDVVSKNLCVSQFIHAGAGAGKTTKLIMTFLQFVRDYKKANGRFPRVVMTTFTRKATQEVKERLLVSALESGEKDIFEFINKKSSVQISTIHGLLSIFLSQYAERMKFPQEIMIIDEMQFERRLKRQINDILKTNPEYLELMESYSFVQLVEFAGSALNFKAQNKEFSFILDHELRSISARKKAEMITLIEKALSLAAGAPKTWDEYFSFLANLVKLLNKNDEDGFLELLQNPPRKPNWSAAKPAFDPSAHVLIEELREINFSKLFDTEEYIRRHHALNQLFYRFVTELSAISLRQKQNTGELSISDLENLSLQLLEEHPETAAEFSETWDYFMIDEYQDTSPLQVRILNQIIRSKPCFIVGDPQQSIYLFRGARSEVFTDKLNEMKSKNAEILFLETNYRSEPKLMNFMNDFFRHFSRQFRPMVAKEQSTENRNIQEDAFFIKSKNQTNAVLTHIQILLALGVDPQDICVLSRSNSKLVDIAIKAAKFSVPVQLQAAGGFEAKREILDLMAFNKFLNNPHDDENLVTLIRSPWFYVADAVILTLAQSPIAKSHSLWSALATSEHPQKVQLLKYLDMYDRAGSLQTTKRFLFETSFISFSEFYDKTGKREANIFKFLTRLAQAEKGVGFSLGLFLEEQFQSLQSDLGSSATEAQPVIQPNCVSLMTVHASKGLQFKHVIVVGFADKPTLSNTQKLTFEDSSQKFSLAVLDDATSRHQPSGWANAIKKKFNERELLENERVLYVAMTRAIETLSLVAEIGKREPSEKSWYKKSNWPLEQGEVETPGYTVRSLTYEELELPVVATERPAGLVRERFAADESQVGASASVTDLLAGKNVRSNGINFETTFINLKKAQKGSDMHRIFESLKYIEPERIFPHLNEQDRKNVKFLLEQTELNLKSILKQGHNEWGFGLKTKSRFIQGQIDLWAELENEIHVLDYKTGSSAYSEKAFEQLAFYTMALHGMNMIPADKKIIHSVVYPTESLIKKKAFENLADFQRLMNQELKEIF